LALYLTKYHNTKTYWRIERIPQRIININTRGGVSGQLQAPATWPLGKELRVPIG